MKKLVLTIAAFLFVTGVTMAQDGDNGVASHEVGINVPTIALVDVENANGEASNISLEPDVSSLEAGSAVNFSTATDNSLWLNYTSIVEGSSNNGNGNNNNTRIITARISEGATQLPAGLHLLLSAGGASTGNGERGQSVADKLELTGSPQDVITGIGSCYTETGENKGHQLTYTLDMDNSNYQTLAAKTYTVTVQYTISN